MSEHMTQQVNASSEEFNEGLEAGLNSAEDTKNWCAGNELGQELKGEVKKGELTSDFKKPETPLFLKGDPGGNKGNAQDEKEETEE